MMPPLKIVDLLRLLDNRPSYAEVVCFARDLDRTNLGIHIGNKGADRLVAGFPDGNVWRILRVEEKLGIVVLSTAADPTGRQPLPTWEGCVGFSDTSDITVGSSLVRAAQRMSAVARLAYPVAMLRRVDGKLHHDLVLELVTIGWKHYDGQYYNWIKRGLWADVPTATVEETEPAGDIVPHHEVLDLLHDPTGCAGWSMEQNSARVSAVCRSHETLRAKLALRSSQLELREREIEKLKAEIGHWRDAAAKVAWAMQHGCLNNLEAQAREVIAANGVSTLMPLGVAQAILRVVGSRFDLWASIPIQHAHQPFVQEAQREREALEAAARAKKMPEKRCGTCGNFRPPDASTPALCPAVHVRVGAGLGNYLVDDDRGPPWPDCKFWRPKEGG